MLGSDVADKSVNRHGPQAAQGRLPGRRAPLCDALLSHRRLEPQDRHAVDAVHGADLDRTRTAAAHHGELRRLARAPSPSRSPTGRPSTRSFTTTPPASSKPTAHALARGKQGRADSIVAWTNIYNGKTRVFGTTLGHNSATVADPRYLDLVTRGLLWAVDKLDNRYLKDPDNVVPEDLARGKPATASSTQSPDHRARRRRRRQRRDAVVRQRTDGPQWWQVDLGKPEDLTGIRIVWEQDGVDYRYKVEGSEDGKSWTMLSDQTQERRARPGPHARFSRPGRPLRSGDRHGLSEDAWASIFEVQVFGTNKVPVPASAATSTSAQHAASARRARTACSARSRYRPAST